MKIKETVEVETAKIALDAIFKKTLKNLTMPVVRRTKTQKRQQQQPEIQMEAGACPTSHPDQVALSTLYRGISMLHFGQIVMAFKKSGLTLRCLTLIGGPILAAGILGILGNAAEKQSLASDTFKRLNASMVVYSLMALGLVALRPQLNNPFGMLWFVASSGTFFVASKGYVAGVRAEAADHDDKNYFLITWRLLKDTVHASLRIPLDITAAAYFYSVVTVTFRNLDLLRTILRILVSPEFSNNEITPNLSRLSKLALLGGSLWTITSMQDEPARNQKTFVFLGLLSCYVLATMSGECLYGFVSVQERRKNLVGSLAMCTANQTSTSLTEMCTLFNSSR